MCARAAAAAFWGGVPLGAWCLAACLLLLAFPRPGAAGEGPGPVVEIDTGLLRGSSAEKVREYLGIPYAAPPVGALRWKAPQPAAPWPQERDARAFGPACPQSGPLESSSNEDCLYLNVWTPARTATAGLPVMVWFHGGGFNFGAASQPEYHGRNLAKRGVVVVTVNYRLGPLGFFAHPLLAAESVRQVSGNYGLLDQIEALKWVRRNIAAFGGDPGRVTIFGQSAGSRSVSLLTLSPLADGLFNRAIAQSGGPIIGSEYMNPAFNGDMASVSAMGRELSAQLGCGKADDELACLRSKTANEIVAAADCKTSLMAEGLFFAPVFDGFVLPGDPVAAYRDGARQQVPMIVGSTGNEGMAYLRGESGLTVEKYRDFLDVRFGQESGEAFAVFPASDSKDVPSAIDRLITVATNAQPARFVARSLEAKGSKAYLYHFVRRPDTARARECGAFHGVDLAYVFGNMNEADGYTAQDRELSRRVMGYWVNFARTGDPNGRGLVEWPVYHRDSDMNLEFANSVAVGRHLYGKECDFIDRVSRFGLLR